MSNLRATDRAVGAAAFVEAHKADAWRPAL